MKEALRASEAGCSMSTCTMAKPCNFCLSTRFICSYVWVKFGLLSNDVFNSQLKSLGQGPVVSLRKGTHLKPKHPMWMQELQLCQSVWIALIISTQGGADHCKMKIIKKVMECDLQRQKKKKFKKKKGKKKIIADHLFCFWQPNIF